MQVLNEGWFDANADRDFPLVDGVSALDLTGVFALPKDLLVDARIAAPASYPSTSFYVHTVSAFGAGLVLTIGVDGVGDVASVTVPLATFTEFTAYTLAPLPGHPLVGGTVVFDHALAVIAAASGIYEFAVAATRILPTLILPAAPAVSSITVVDAFGAEHRLTGAVTLQAGDNAALTVSGQDLEFAMETGVLLEDPCGCRDTGGNLRTAIKSVNGVTPDANGNLTVTGVGCAQVTAAGSTLKIADSCAQPCCGSPELELLQEAARSLQSYLSTVANRSAELEAALRSIQAHLPR